MGFALILVEGKGTQSKTSSWGYEANVYWGNQWMIEDSFNIHRVTAIPEGNEPNLRFKMYGNVLSLYDGQDLGQKDREMYLNILGEAQKDSTMLPYLYRTVR